MVESNGKKSSTLAHRGCHDHAEERNHGGSSADSVTASLEESLLDGKRQQQYRQDLSSDHKRVYACREVERWAVELGADAHEPERDQNDGAGNAAGDVRVGVIVRIAAV